MSATAPTEVVTQLRSNVLKLQRHVSEQSGALRQRDATIDLQAKELEALNKRLKEQTAVTLEREETIERQTKELDEAAQSGAYIVELLEKEQQRLEASKGQVSALEMEVNELQLTVSEQQHRMERQERVGQTVDDELDSARQKTIQLQATNTELEAQVRSLENTRTELERSVSDLTASLRESEALALAATVRSTEDEEKRIAEAQHKDEQLSQLSETVRDLQSQRRYLQVQLSSSSRAKGDAITKTMELEDRLTAATQRQDELEEANQKLEMRVQELIHEQEQQKKFAPPPRLEIPETLNVLSMFSPPAQVVVPEPAKEVLCTSCGGDVAAAPIPQNEMFFFHFSLLHHSVKEALSAVRPDATQLLLNEATSKALFKEATQRSVHISMWAEFLYSRSVEILDTSEAAYMEPRDNDSEEYWSSDYSDTEDGGVWGPDPVELMAVAPAATADDAPDAAAGPSTNDHHSISSTASSPKVAVAAAAAASATAAAVAVSTAAASSTSSSVTATPSPLRVSGRRRSYSKSPLQRSASMEDIPSSSSPPLHLSRHRHSPVPIRSRSPLSDHTPLHSHPVVSAHSADGRGRRSRALAVRVDHSGNFSGMAGLSVPSSAPPKPRRRSFGVPSPRQSSSPHSARSDHSNSSRRTASPGALVSSSSSAVAASTTSFRPKHFRRAGSAGAGNMDRLWGVAEAQREDALHRRSASSPRASAVEWLGGLEGLARRSMPSSPRSDASGAASSIPRSVEA